MSQYIFLVPFFLFVILQLLAKAQTRQKTKKTISISRNTRLTTRQMRGLFKLHVRRKVDGCCYAANSLKNEVPSRGEWHSPNRAKPVNSAFPRQGLYLALNEKEKVVYDDIYLGYKLYLVNTNGTATHFRAENSRLNIVAEALNKNGEWIEITQLTHSWCGNSYHTVTLGKDEYWSFNVPVFVGSMKIKLRYTVLLTNGKKISSNAVNAWLAKEQLESVVKTMPSAFKYEDLRYSYQLN